MKTVYQKMTIGPSFPFLCLGKFDGVLCFSLHVIRNIQSGTQPFQSTFQGRSSQGERVISCAVLLYYCRQIDTFLGRNQIDLLRIQRINSLDIATAQKYIPVIVLHFFLVCQALPLKLEAIFAKLYALTTVLQTVCYKITNWV